MRFRGPSRNSVNALALPAPTRPSLITSLVTAGAMSFASQKHCCSASESRPVSAAKPNPDWSAAGRGTPNSCCRSPCSTSSSAVIPPKLDLIGSLGGRWSCSNSTVTSEEPLATTLVDTLATRQFQTLGRDNQLRVGRLLPYLWEVAIHITLPAAVGGEKRPTEPTSAGNWRRAACGRGRRGDAAWMAFATIALPANVPRRVASFPPLTSTTLSRALSA